MQNINVVGNKILEMTSIFLASKWNCSIQLNKYSWASFSPSREETSTSELRFLTESPRRGSCNERKLNWKTWSSCNGRVYEIFLEKSLGLKSLSRLFPRWIQWTNPVVRLTMVLEMDNSTNLPLSWSMMPSSISFFFSAFSLLFRWSSALLTTWCS